MIALDYLQKIVEGSDLTFSEAEALMGDIFSSATDAQIAAALVALSTGSLAVRTADQEAMSQSLAQTQLEDIKAAPYAGTYPAIDEPGYDIFVGVDPIPDTNDNIQKVTVTISRDGETLLVLEDFKVNR